jgi:hypothetical protein
MESYEKNPENLDYDITLNIRKGVYHFCIPDLILTTKGTNLETAYQQLMVKKDDFFKDAKEAGIEISPEETRGSNRQRYNQSTLKRFSARFLIVFSIVLLSFFVLTQMTTYFINKSLNNINNRVETSLNNINSQFNDYVGSGKNLPRSVVISTKFQDVFDTERQKRILTSLRIVVEHMKPFAKELSLIFSEERSL